MGSAGAAWQSFTTKMTAIKTRKAAKEMREENARMRRNQPAPILSTANAEPEKEINVDELEERKSGVRGSINNVITIMVLLVMAALGLLIYHIAKQVGNPGQSEYPNKLVHRDTKFLVPSPFVDLELGLELASPKTDGSRKRIKNADVGDRSSVPAMEQGPEIVGPQTHQLSKFKRCTSLSNSIAQS